MFGWWSDVIKESREGDHTPVVSIGLRYGMILFIASEVMFFVAWFWIFFEMALFHHDRTFSAIDEVRNAWGDLAAQGRRDARPLALPADQHADPADLGHHRHLGAPRAAGTATARAPRSACPDHPARHLLHLRPGLRVPRDHHREAVLQHRERPTAGLYGSSFFMATGFHGFHVLIGTIFLIVCLLRLLGRPVHAEEALRLRGGRLVLALRRRGLAVPVRLHLRDLRPPHRAQARSLLSTAPNPVRRRPSRAAARTAARGRCSPASSACASAKPARPAASTSPRGHRRRAGGVRDPDRRASPSSACCSPRSLFRPPIWVHFVVWLPLAAAAVRRPAAALQGRDGRAAVPPPCLRVPQWPVGPPPAAPPRAARQGRQAPPGRGRAIVGLLLTAVGVALLVWLGVWQLQRKAWKEQLLARIETLKDGAAGAPERGAATACATAASSTSCAWWPRCSGLGERAVHLYAHKPDGTPGWRQVGACRLDGRPLRHPPGRPRLRGHADRRRHDPAAGRRARAAAAARAR